MLTETLRFQKERPVINQNNGCWTAALLHLLGEVAELEEEAAAYFDGLAREEDIVSEACDVINFCVALIHSLGFDPEKALQGKNLRNNDKYPIEELQEGDYDTKMKDLKYRWNGHKKTENIIYMSPARL